MLCWPANQVPIYGVYCKFLALSTPISIALGSGRTEWNEDFPRQKRENNLQPEKRGIKKIVMVKYLIANIR